MSITIYLLELVAFLDLLAVSLIVPLLPQHVRKLGGNEIYVGLLGSIYAGFQLLSGPLLGSLSDLKGRKPVLETTLLLCSLAYVTLGLTNSILVIMVMRAVLGIFKQTQVQTKALVSDYIPNERKQGAVYGEMAAISGLGMTLGPLIGGHIAEDHPENGFALVGVLVSLCFALNACLVYLLPKPLKEGTRKSTTTTGNHNNMMTKMYTSVKQSFLELYHIKWSKYWDIFMFKALVGFAMGVYYSNYSTYLRTIFGLSPKYIGYVISFQGVIGSLSSFFMGFINSCYINDKDYSIRNFHVFLLLSTSIIGMVLSFNIFVYSIWLIPLAIGNAIGRLVTLEMVLKRGDGDHTGTLIGASNSVRSLAGVVAPMATGVIGQYIGVSYVIYASLSSTLLGLVLSYRHKNKLKEE